MELGDSYGRVGGRIMGPEGDRNSTGRSSESTNLDPLGYQSLNYQPKSEHRLHLDSSHPRTYVANEQIGLHVGLKQPEQRLSQKLFPVSGTCSSWAALSGLSGRGCA